MYDNHESINCNLHATLYADNERKLSLIGEQLNMNIKLPGAEIGKVVTRFPPEPSGYLHIGHAKAAMLNQYFAQEYKGKMILRFDDTNPTKEKAYLTLLGIHADQITYTSDHFEELYQYAIKIINKGLAYVDDTDVTTASITGGPEVPYTKDLPKHKKNPNVGTKKTWFSSTIFIDQNDAKTFEIDEEITLMDWGNAIVKSVHKSDSDPETVLGLDLQLHLEGDYKKTKKKITWLADTEDVLEIVLADYDYLINKRKLEENDEVTDYVTEKTEFLTSALADSNVRMLKKGDIIQFERKGYYILDDNISTTSVPRFNHIPDGKASSMASKAASEIKILKEVIIREIIVFRK
ncbi:5859_t:CDS:2 [Racocetra fulgida]|uniref:glutamate--tRNA ligase n=1 Tax=Racocetra fulgida TaxID=60492 RepID=A0A9N9F0E6_9GLOM|nr:5859_t:CDS:2 [Racocetra fulgida]